MKLWNKSFKGRPIIYCPIGLSLHAVNLIRTASAFMRRTPGSQKSTNSKLLFPSDEQPASPRRRAVWNPNRANGGTLVGIHRGRSHTDQARAVFLGSKGNSKMFWNHPHKMIKMKTDWFRPEELDFPNTMTDIDYHTWMLSGSAVMRDGQVIPELLLLTS